MQKPQTCPECHASMEEGVTIDLESRRTQTWLRGPVEETRLTGITIAEGQIDTGMVLLAQLEKWPNLVVSVPIRSVEGIHGGSNQEPVALVLGDVAQAIGGYSDILLTPGTVIDVLLHAPSA